MAGPKLMFLVVAAAAAGAITFWSYGDSPEPSAPPSEETAKATTDEVAGPQPAMAEDFVLREVSEDEPHIPMGDGTRLPPLNGVTDTTGLRWPYAKTKSPVIGITRIHDGKDEAYLHEDGTLTTTLIATDPKTGRVMVIPRVVRPIKKDFNFKTLGGEKLKDQLLRTYNQ